MAVATLAHVELRCPDLAASVEHFTRVVGLEESRRQDGTVYLRGWGDWDAFTLALSDDDEMGLAHAAFKVDEAADLEGYAERIEASGYTPRWVEAGTEPGQPRALRFPFPGTHPEHPVELELVHGMERATIPEGKKPRLKNQPQRYIINGIAPRQIHHTNLLVPNPRECRDWVESVLDLKLRERIVVDGEEKAAFLSAMPIDHELAFVYNPTPELNHVAWYTDHFSDVRRATEVLKAEEVKVYEGPSRHGATQGQFVYHVEPSGNLFEVYSGGMLLDPDWEPVTWYEDELNCALEWWGSDDEVYDWPQTAEKR